MATCEKIFDKTFQGEIMKKQYYFLINIAIIGFIVFFINAFFFQVCFVNGDSMNPTYKNGQILIANKFDKDIKRNDIIVININKKTIIKRVVGIPNDKVQCIDGYLYVNGIKFDDKFMDNPGAISSEIVLGEDEYFVLGDNRNYSIDSRFEEIGIISKRNIKAKIIL